jgi:DNA-binding response OmpR family regulator
MPEEPLSTTIWVMAGTIPTVLVVEDERRIREVVRGYLEQEGLAVLTAPTGATALELAATGGVDLVILDLRLPDIPGEEVAHELRGRDVPIIVLTAKATEEDRIRGLELGVDDYVTKPFSPRELVLRVRAVLRRGHEEKPDAACASFGGGELILDASRMEARVRGAAVALTPTEYRLLAALASSPGRVHSRYELVNRVRGVEFDGYERTIDSHVKNLRRKIELDPHRPHIVQTVIEGGYRLGLSLDP